MNRSVLIDNDVIIKASAYDLGAETLASTTLDGSPPAMLGVGRFVVMDRLARSRWLVNRARAQHAFSVLLRGMATIEPSQRELLAAAELEAAATRLNLDLDGGESQLLAVMIVRSCRLLITGDKRAVRAIAKVAAAEARHRVGSFEQLIFDIVNRTAPSELQIRICAEPGADTALTICFGCSSMSAPASIDMRAALSSYIGHLRRETSDVLLPSDDLSALAA